jgi:hypothetical protein
MTSRAERLLAAAVRRLPAGRRELGQALLAELSVIPAGRRRAAWIAGGMWFVVKENAMRSPAYPLGLAAAVAALIAVDRMGTSDDGGQVSLPVLLAGSALLGFAVPRLAWLAGLVVGASLAAADAVRVAPGAHAGAASLLVLIVPAMIAAYLGAGTAWLLRHSRHAPDRRG